MTRAACVAVGSELLGDRRLDRNSLTITAALNRIGVEVVEKRVVGDDQSRLVRTLEELLDEVDLVIVTGGLGPTADDITRAAVAEAVHRDLVRDEMAEEQIRDRYRRAERSMPEICLSMARTVQGARVLVNTRGSAPGLLVEHRGCTLAILPGVPWEMEGMLERDVVPLVAGWNPGIGRRSRTLLLAGVIESQTEERICHLYERWGRHNVTILAAYGVLRLVLTAEGDPTAAEARLDEMEAAFTEVLADDLAGVAVGGIAEVVLELLRQRRCSLATAESCTGGLVGEWLTEVAGSSEVYVGGIISYSNQVKEELLGVSEAMLVEHGAVSEPVARAMAEGARRRLRSDWGLGVTGIAGPGGGTETKPVGLVHWAVAGPNGTVAEHRVFAGDRAIVRTWSANAVLDLLRRQVLHNVYG